MSDTARRAARTRMQGQQVRRGTATPHKDVELVWYSSIDTIGEPRWVIDMVMPDEAVSMLYGPSGKGKTF